MLHPRGLNSKHNVIEMTLGRSTDITFIQYSTGPATIGLQGEEEEQHRTIIIIFIHTRSTIENIKYIHTEVS